LFTRAFITKATNLSQINFSSAGFSEIRRNNFPVTDSCVECFEYRASYLSVFLFIKAAATGVQAISASIKPCFTYVCAQSFVLYVPETQYAHEHRILHHYNLVKLTNLLRC